MVEAFLQKVLTEKYGDFRLERLTGGYTNDTFLLKGKEKPLVVKIARLSNKDIENEIRCLHFLQDTAIVPKLYEFIKAEDLQVMVMDLREGSNGQSILDANDLERTKRLYQFLGEALATKIHAKMYTNSTGSGGIRECNLNELSLDLSFVPDQLVKASRDILSTIKDTSEKWVLTHGDYGVHNVLFTESNQLTVLDWEWAEWGNPLADIGWVLWFTKLHYSEIADTLIENFLKGYINFNPLKIESDTLKAYCVYKVWKVLHRVKHASNDIQEEWVRRLKWTLETEF